MKSILRDSVALDKVFRHWDIASLSLSEGGEDPTKKNFYREALDKHTLKNLCNGAISMAWTVTCAAGTSILW
jgi:hypothetical protein